MNLETIKKDYELEGTTLSELRRELIKKLVAIHPDKNQGVFKNTSDEELFHKINRAIESIDKQLVPHNSLISINEAKDLIELVTKQVSVTSQINTASQKLSQSTERSLVLIRSRYRFPKFTSTILSVITTTVWLFPNQVKDHPFLGKLINFDNVWFQVAWLEILLLTGMCWYLAYLKEQRQTDFLNEINLEHYQNSLFSMFLHRNISRNQTFDKASFMKYLLSSYETPRRIRYFSIRPELDTITAASIADVVFERAVEKGLIHKINSNALEDQYEIAT